MKMSWLKTIGIGLLATLLLAAPMSYANSKDLDMADRIYEKYQEREKSKRREQPAQQNRNNDERAVTRNPARPDQRNKAREVQDKRSTDSRNDSRSQSSRDNSQQNDQQSKDLERMIRNAVDDRSSNNQRERSSSSDSVARYQQRAEQRRSNNGSPTSSRQNSAPRGNEVSLDQAVNMVRRKTDAQVLSAKSSGTKHRIKVLIDGRRVRTYVVDAVTGEIF